MPLPVGPPRADADVEVALRVKAGIHRPRRQRLKRLPRHRHLPLRGVASPLVAVDPACGAPGRAPGRGPRQRRCGLRRRPPRLSERGGIRSRESSDPVRRQALPDQHGAAQV